MLVTVLRLVESLPAALIEGCCLLVAALIEAAAEALVDSAADSIELALVDNDFELLSVLVPEPLVEATALILLIAEIEVAILSLILFEVLASEAESEADLVAEALAEAVLEAIAEIEFVVEIETLSL